MRVAAEATTTVTGGNSAGVGIFTVFCSGGADRAGNAAETVQVSYTVGYGLVGFFHPISDPAPTPSAFRKGPTVPVKFALTDDAGRRISDADGATIAAGDARLSWARTAAAATSAGAPANSNPANTERFFCYDAATDKLLYNLGTKDSPPAPTASRPRCSLGPPCTPSTTCWWRFSRAVYGGSRPTASTRELVRTKPGVSPGSPVSLARHWRSSANLQRRLHQYFRFGRHN